MGLAYSQLAAARTWSFRPLTLTQGATVHAYLAGERRGRMDRRATGGLPGYGLGGPPGKATAMVAAAILPRASASTAAEEYSTAAGLTVSSFTTSGFEAAVNWQVTLHVDVAFVVHLLSCQHGPGPSTNLNNKKQEARRTQGAAKGAPHIRRRACSIKAQRASQVK